jgi:hypothetical protein
MDWFWPTISSLMNTAPVEAKANITVVQGTDYSVYASFVPPRNGFTLVCSVVNAKNYSGSFSAISETWINGVKHSYGQSFASQNYFSTAYVTAGVPVSIQHRVVGQTGQSDISLSVICLFLPSW